LRYERTGVSFLGMRRQGVLQETSCKSLNENLRPLERYLWQQRGRPWNHVYSDICSVLDVSSTVKQHVRDHIDDFVERRVHVDQEGRWLSGGINWRCAQPPEHWRCDLYVDPSDGILKDTASLLKRLGLERYCYEPWTPPDLGPRHILDKDHECRPIDGIWYLLPLGDRAAKRPDDASLWES